MKPLELESSQVLFGTDSQKGIVAVEPVGRNRMRLFIREGTELKTGDKVFTPFMLLEDGTLMEGFDHPYQVESLSSVNEYRFLVLFERWDDCIKARAFIQKKTGRSASSPQAPYLFLSDPVHQFLLLTGKTLFKGLAFKDIHRLALDIETACAPGYEFSNPEREEDRILSIALASSTGSSGVLFGNEMDEREMLLSLGEKIRELDPDVIEGHNLFNFDLEYIRARAALHDLKLNWGRDGSEPQIRRSRFTAAERIIDFSRMDIFGRHVVDTMFLLQSYDVSARELESYGLKSAARHFGLAGEDRTYIEGKDVQWFYEHKPEELKKYNIEDAEETLALSELLGYSFFLQAKIFPFSFQNIFVRGNATKINALFLREYLRKKTSIPKPKGARKFEGGYTDVFVHGLVRNVVHCDVASLYPSVMISYGLKPSSDSLDVFLPLLGDLRKFRLDAKRLAKESQTKHDVDYYQALQQTFKVLINSFYGYLGTELHHFADPEVAAQVTQKGREIILAMLEWLREEKATPVEIDTDGIYFVPPPGVNTEKEAEALVNRLSQSLPGGIDVGMDGLYPAMFSYKMKNYALLDEKGRMLIKGSALRSRGMERYLRDFLSDTLQLLLEGRGEEVRDLLEHYTAEIENHKMDISRLAKTETLSEPLESYRQKVRTGKRNPAALYELALASGRPYRAGDQLSYYVTGSKKSVRVYDNCKPAGSYDKSRPDENVAYYKEKLIALYERFREFLPGEEGRKKKGREAPTEEADFLTMEV
ncbi:MAG: DNA polymerase II [Deltaproteobacteria bacterium]|nr:DNA polymerase II [Deltaproteobacteria bacterium]